MTSIAVMAPVDLTDERALDQALDGLAGAYDQVAFNPETGRAWLSNYGPHERDGLHAVACIDLTTGREVDYRA